MRGFLIATTFTDCRENHDVRDDDWCMLHLERAPFGLTPVLAILDEGCTESDGAYDDKSLGVWRVEDLREEPLSRH